MNASTDRGLSKDRRAELDTHLASLLLPDPLTAARKVGQARYHLHSFFEEHASGLRTGYSDLWRSYRRRKNQLRHWEELEGKVTEMMENYLRVWAEEDGIANMIKEAISIVDVTEE